MNMNVQSAPINHQPLQLETLDFDLPSVLEASEPPEIRGVGRDDVRLMASYSQGDYVKHLKFKDIVDILEAGDVLVINTSRTMNAAIKGIRKNNVEQVEVHLSTQLPDGNWVVELREIQSKTTRPIFNAKTNETIILPENASIQLIKPYNSFVFNDRARTRLWVAKVILPTDVYTYTNKHGFPIRYSYVNNQWHSDYYQTVYATNLGSAEMPSAGRAFTTKIITKLIAKGVHIVPLVLHTGVASLEDNEPPYEEYYHVPKSTAQIINLARQSQKRIIAVGTTVVRALETVTDLDGLTSSGAGWTNIFITPERGIHAVNGILTGLHEPKATHLAMLEALVGRKHLRISYQQALENRYLWHEFGDLHLILP